MDVAQELIVREEDCGTSRGIWLEEVVPDSPGRRSAWRSAPAGGSLVEPGRPG